MGLRTREEVKKDKKKIMNEILERGDLTHAEILQLFPEFENIDYVRSLIEALSQAGCMVSDGIRICRVTGEFSGSYKLCGDRKNPIRKHKYGE